MLKAEARKIYKAKRKELSDKNRNKLDDLLLIEFQKSGFPDLNLLFSYIPLNHHHEPDTALFERWLQFKNPGLKICYPVSDFETNSMRAIVPAENSRFISNEFLIPEPETGEWMQPEEIDVVFVPLLAFDLQGYRVGYGKGFYDQYLQNCRKDCVKVGFSYFDPIHEITDQHRFDVPLDLCITPNRTYAF